MVGKHDEDYREARSTGLLFAHRVIHAMGVSPAHERIPTPQVLVDMADAVIDDPEHVVILCTTWQDLPGGIEICSVGSNSVLVFEEDTVREVTTPHTVNDLLRSQGRATSPIGDNQLTHVLGSRTYKRRCRVENVRVAHIPLSPTTTIAIIENRRLAEALIQREVPRHELSSFIDEWTPPGKRIRTSVLISL